MFFFFIFDHRGKGEKSYETCSSIMQLTSIFSFCFELKWTNNPQTGGGGKRLKWGGEALGSVSVLVLVCHRSRERAFEKNREIREI